VVTLKAHHREGGIQVSRVPQDDSCDQNVQSRCAISLALKGTIAQFTKSMKEYSACQRIAFFAFGQSKVGPSS
jgi:hypothetical protein